MFGHKQDGMADLIAAGLIALAMLVGATMSRITGKADHPVEQAAESYIKMTTGQEIDYSAHLKKLPNGQIVATNVKANTTNLPQSQVIIEHPYVK